MPSLSPQNLQLMASLGSATWAPGPPGTAGLLPVLSGPGLGHGFGPRELLGVCPRGRPRSSRGAVVPVSLRAVPALLQPHNPPSPQRGRGEQGQRGASDRVLQRGGRERGCEKETRTRVGAPSVPRGRPTAGGRPLAWPRLTARGPGPGVHDAPVGTAVSPPRPGCEERQQPGPLPRGVPSPVP